MKEGKAESPEYDVKMGVRWGWGEAETNGQGGAKGFESGEWAVSQIPGSHTKY